MMHTNCLFLGILTCPPAFSVINGEIFSIVPDRLLLFPAPAPTDRLAPGCDWADEEGGRRVFSAEYYADLLQELGVSAVVCLDRYAPSFPFFPSLQSFASIFSSIFRFNPSSQRTFPRIERMLQRRAILAARR